MIEILTLPVLAVSLISTGVSFMLSMYAASSLRAAQRTVSITETERGEEIWKAYSYMKVAAICAMIAFCTLLIGGYMVSAIIK